MLAGDFGILLLLAASGAMPVKAAAWSSLCGVWVDRAESWAGHGGRVLSLFCSGLSHTRIHWLAVPGRYHLRLIAFHMTLLPGTAQHSSSVSAVENALMVVPGGSQEKL